MTINIKMHSRAWMSLWDYKLINNRIGGKLFSRIYKLITSRFDINEWIVILCQIYCNRKCRKIQRPNLDWNPRHSECKQSVLTNELPEHWPSQVQHSHLLIFLWNTYFSFKNEQYINRCFKLLNLNSRIIYIMSNN